MKKVLLFLATAGLATAACFPNPLGSFDSIVCIGPTTSMSISSLTGTTGVRVLYGNNTGGVTSAADFTYTSATSILFAGKRIQITADVAPGAPAANNFHLYFDSADSNRLKDISSASSVRKYAMTTELVDYVVGPASAVNREITIFNGTSGKLVATGTGCTITSGVTTCTGGFVSGDGTKSSVIDFPELVANGTSVTSIYGPSALAADSCYILPSVAGVSGQVLGDSGTTAATTETVPRTCNVLIWITVSVSGGVGEWTSTVDFANILDLACVENTFSATGLTPGTPLLLVTPATINTSLVGRAWASAADTAKVQLCNTSGADIDPASASFTVKAARGYLNATATIDYANICAGCTVSNTVTVTGATTAFGATVSVPSALASGLLASARVTAANTVTVSIFNASAADVDPASGGFTAMVIQ